MPAISTIWRASRDDPRHVFVEGDIGDARSSRELLTEHRPRAIVNFAAESHVDRSIHGPADFIATNVVGTYRLLEAARAYLATLGRCERERVPLPARVDRRGLRLARSRRRAVYRDHTVSRRTVPIRHRKRRPIIWCAPGTTPTACRC